MNADHHNYETLFLLNIYFKVDFILSRLKNVYLNSFFYILDVCQGGDQHV